MNKKEYIVALEGIDGAGKTTIISRLQQQLSPNAVPYMRTKKGRILDKVVSSDFMQKHTILQIPLYLILSYKNYFVYLWGRYRKKGIRGEPQVVIMDRCFLSNICYFFPNVIDNGKLLKFIMAFEVRLFPDTIFIIDVDPKVGWERDSNKKSLKWMEKTRLAYLRAAQSDLKKNVQIEIIATNFTVEEKVNIILKCIRRNLGDGC